jgi:hypothetical protein
VKFHYVPAKKKQADFLFMLPGVIILLFLPACSMSVPISGPNNDKAQFYLMIYNDKQDLIKDKTLSEADPSFWVESQNIPLNIYPAQVTAWGIGGIKGGETALEDAKAATPSLITQGINPVSGIATGLGVLLAGPQRAQDPVFQERISQLLDAYDWQIDDYFFQLLQKGTMFSFDRQSGDNFIFDRFGSPMKPLEKLAKVNGIIFLNFTLSPSRMSGWTEPKYVLEANAGLTVITKEAWDAFKAQFSDEMPVFSDMRPQSMVSGATLRKVSGYPGMYMASIYKNSDYYTREQWLSNNGAFLQEQLKAAIAYMAQEADRLVFTGK